MMEPSTSPMSYGPFAIALLASGKYAISTAPATPSSSSSASSRLSWHPSHDANLNTAILGLELILFHQRPDNVTAKHRPILADEMRTVLAMAAQTDTTFHVAFHREINVFAPESHRIELAQNEAHHNFRPTNHRHRLRRLQTREFEQGSDYADVPAPAQAAVINGGENLCVILACPRFQLFAIEKIPGTACAVQQHEPPVVGAMIEHFVDDGPQWREPDAPSDDDKVASPRGLERPRRPIRPAHSYRTAHLLTDQGMGRRTYRSDGVHEMLRLRRISADRNGQLPDSIHPQHAELTRQKCRSDAVLRLHGERERIVGFLCHRAHYERRRQHRVRIVERFRRMQHRIFDHYAHQATA